MRTAGIDVSRFKAHVLRSASMRAAIDSGELVDSTLERAVVSQKVFSIYYDIPVAQDSVQQSTDNAAAAPQAVSLAAASSVPLRIDSVAASVPSNHSDSSGVFSRRSLMDGAVEEL